MDGDIEISERHSGSRSNSNEYSSDTDIFVRQFMDTVSVKTIMGMSRSIARPDARLMLAQFRGCNLEFITLDDPAVLMLDGLALSEFENFLHSGGADLEMLIRGGEDAMVDGVITGGTTNNPNPEMSPIPFHATGSKNSRMRGVSTTNRRTLKELNQCLKEFKQAKTVSERAEGRRKFYECFESLDVVQKLQIPTMTCKQIQDAFQLGHSYQETVLESLDFSFYYEREEEKGEGEAHVRGLMITNTGSLYGEAQSAERRHIRTRSELRSRVATLESKNVCSWIRSNCGSQHVWFFFASICMFVAFFVQIWIDFAFGQIWRAILMQLLSLTAVLMCVMEADTPFIRAIIQERLYNSYLFLQGIKGRTIFYALVCFLAFGSFTIYDSLAICGGCLMLSLTIVRFILYQLSNLLLDDMIYPLLNTSMMREKFAKLDENQDGYLSLSDMRDVVKDSNFRTRWLKEVIFWRLDSATNDGQIDLYEFVKFCSAFRANVDSVSARKKERLNQM